MAEMQWPGLESPSPALSHPVKKGKKPPNKYLQKSINAVHRNKKLDRESVLQGKLKD